MPRIPNWLISLIVLIALALIAYVWISLRLPSFDQIIFPETGVGGRTDLFIRQISIFSRAILSSVNAGISAMLFIIYFKVYRQARMKISIGLMIFSIAMFLHSLISNPVIFYRAARVIGLPVIFEQIFAFVALASILYISLK